MKRHRRGSIPDHVAAQILDHPVGKLDPVYAEDRRRLLERLAGLGLPDDLWRLSIDWRRNADWFDQSARAWVAARSFAEQQKDMRAISTLLRRVAIGLNAPGYSELSIGFVLELASEYLERPGWSMSPATQAEDVRVCDFLKALAELLSGDLVAWLAYQDDEGFNLRVTPTEYVDGVENLGVRIARRTRKKQDGMAAVAANGLRKFMLANGLGPQDALVDEIVSAYYPDASPRDRARGARKRAEKFGKK